jgi:hypothetical protein
LIISINDAIIVFSYVTSNFDRFLAEAGCFCKIAIIDNYNSAGFGADWQLLQCLHAVVFVSPK